MQVAKLCAVLCLVPSAALASSISAPTPQYSAVAAAASFHPLNTLGRTVTRDDMIANDRASQEPRANGAHALSRDELCSAMASAAQDHALPVAFFTSLIWRESGFRSHAVSPVGAQGVAQFMPKVADAMGLENPFNPVEALPMAARLLRSLVNQFGNHGLAAAAYNTGPARVSRWLDKRGSLPKETQDYVRIITGRPAEEWRDAGTASAEFRTPAHTRCPIVASRVETAENGRLRFHDIANVPLPPRRPGSEPPASTMVADNAVTREPEFNPRPLVQVIARRSVVKRTAKAVVAASTVPVLRAPKTMVLAASAKPSGTKPASAPSRIASANRPLVLVPKSGPPLKAKPVRVAAAR